MVVVEDRTQRPLGVRIPAQKQLRMSDRVQTRGVKLDAMAVRERQHPIRDLQRPVGVACIVFQPREVVEDLQAERCILCAFCEPKRALVPRPSLLQSTGALKRHPESEEMLGAQPARRAVIEQLDRTQGVLPCTWVITDGVEEHGQQTVAASQQLLILLLCRPLVDLADELAAGRVLTDPAEHVGLDQLGPALEAIEPQLACLSLQRHGWSEGCLCI